MFDVEFTSKAEKQFNKLDKTTKMSLFNLIEQFSSTAFPKNYDIVKVKIAGKEQIYRVKIGDFRLLYLVGAPKKIIILAIKPRKSAYKS